MVNIHNTYEKDYLRPIAFLKEGGAAAGFYDTDTVARSIELDVAQESNSTTGKYQWSVSHEEAYMPPIYYGYTLPPFEQRPYIVHKTRQLSDYLAELRAWHLWNPQHDVVTLVIDIKRKGDNKDFPWQLDAYLDSFLGNGPTDRSIFFTPKDLMRGVSPAVALREAALANGWPKLSELRGRFLIVMSDEYLRAARVGEQLGFAQRSADGTDAAGNGSPSKLMAESRNVLFLNYHLFGPPDDRIWIEPLAKVCGDPSVLIRGYVIQTKWLAQARRAGLNLFATDDKGFKSAWGWNEPFEPRLNPVDPSPAIVNRWSGLVADVRGNQMLAGTAVQQWPWFRADNQKWRFENVTGGISISPRFNSRLVLSVGEATSGEATVELQEANAKGYLQTWHLDPDENGSTLIKLIQSGQRRGVLSVPDWSITKGTALQISEYRERPPQSAWWRLVYS